MNFESELAGENYSGVHYTSHHIVGRRLTKRHHLMNFFKNSNWIEEDNAHKYVTFSAIDSPEKANALHNLFYTQELLHFPIVMAHRTLYTINAVRFSKVNVLKKLTFSGLRMSIISQLLCLRKATI
jgi:hypothetical protein